MTAPVANSYSYPPTCLVLVDGVRMADGQPTDSSTAPTVLTDLRVVWGRANTLDQPSPASLTMTVMDAQGGQAYRDALHIGARVDVDAEGILYPDPTQPTIPDPGFEAAPLGPLPAATAYQRNVAAQVVAAPAGGTGHGAHALLLNPTVAAADASGVVVLTIGPAPFGAADAWDALPRTLAGQTWRYGAETWLGAWGLGGVQVVTIEPVSFSTATMSPGDTLPGSPRLTSGPGAGAWQALSGTITPPGGVWLGLRITVAPNGPTWDQIPDGLAWDSLPTPRPTWDDLTAVWIDNLQLLAPTNAPAARKSRVFSGRITDLEARYSDDLGATAVKVIAQDDLAELGNRFVGDNPWLAETLAARAQRIVTAAAQSTTLVVGSTISGVQVSWRDVDSRGASELLASLARSVAGVLWTATSPTAGASVHIDDVNARASILVLRMVGGVVVILPRETLADPTKPGIVIDACDVLLDPVTWDQTTEDDATQVALTWREQTTDTGGQPKPTDRTIERIDAAQEALTGRRRVSLTTELADVTTAGTVADSVFGRIRAPGWRVSGLTWRLDMTDHLDSVAVGRVMQLLDGTIRLGLPILLTGLPDWSPVSGVDRLALYLEGASYTNSGGGWVLQLLTSAATGQGAGSAAWDALDPAWRWDDFSPSITWNDMQGVGV